MAVSPPGGFPSAAGGGSGGAGSVSPSAPGSPSAFGGQAIAGQSGSTRQMRRWIDNQSDNLGVVVHGPFHEGEVIVGAVVSAVSDMAIAGGYPADGFGIVQIRAYFSVKEAFDLAGGSGGFLIARSRPHASHMGNLFIPLNWRLGRSMEGTYLVVSVTGSPDGGVATAGWDHITSGFVMGVG